MPRPDSIILWFIALFLLRGFTLPTHAADRPSILWLTCEDMSPRLGCYGDDTVPTPNIDRLAGQGLRFTRAFGTYGVCSPNRHTLILGMYPTSTGAMAMRTWRRTSALEMITDVEYSMYAPLISSSILMGMTFSKSRSAVGLRKVCAS